MQKINRNGQILHYDFYKGQKSITIVFIHGWGANHTIWEEECKYFIASGCSVLNLDLRCHGHSICSKKPDFSDFAEDIALIMKRAGISKAVLVGHSMGGLIALDFYKKNPKKVMAAILINSSYQISKKTLRFFLPVKILGIKIIDILARRRKKKPTHMNFQKFKKASGIKIIYEMMSSKDYFLFSDEFLKDLVKIDFSGMLKKIKIPVLIISSSHDEFFRMSESKRMAELIPQGRFHEIKGTHSSVIKNPDEINRSIGNFIKENCL